MNHKIFDFTRFYDLYDYIIIKLSGVQSEIWDLVESMRDVMPHCVINLNHEIYNDSAVLKILYLNSKYHFDYINSLVDIVIDDYQGLSFDIIYPICGYDKISNFIICLFSLLVFVLIKFYHINFVRHVNKLSYYLGALLGILVGVILSIITMIYFEKITQVISVAMYHDEQKVKLLRNIIIDVMVILVFHLVDLLLQIIILYFVGRKEHMDNCICNCDKYNKKEK